MSCAFRARLASCVVAAAALVGCSATYVPPSAQQDQDPVVTIEVEGTAYGSSTIHYTEHTGYVTETATPESTLRLRAEGQNYFRGPNGEDWGGVRQLYLLAQGGSEDYLVIATNPDATSRGEVPTFLRIDGWDGVSGPGNLPIAFEVRWQQPILIQAFAVSYTGRLGVTTLDVNPITPPVGPEKLPPAGASNPPPPKPVTFRATLPARPPLGGVKFTGVNSKGERFEWTGRPTSRDGKEFVAEAKLAPGRWTVIAVSTGTGHAFAPKLVQVAAADDNADDADTASQDVRFDDAKARAKPTE